MTRLFLDIETIPTQDQAARAEIAAGVTPPGSMSKADTIAAWEKEKKPALVEEAWRRTSFDGALGQIVVIGCALEDAKPACHFESDPKRCTTLAAEAAVLRAFFKSLQKVPETERHGLVVVGHNVAEFDLRFIWQRSVIHGIRPPHWMPWNAKPWGDRVFDTMLAWAGARGRISLDKLCKVLGVAGKGSEIGDEIDGSKVWDFVASGRIAEVATYCEADVARAREIHARLTFAEVL